MNEESSLQSSPQLASDHHEQVAVALHPKQIYSLYKKSQQSNIPFSTLEEVYKRGFNEVSENKEQNAFNRVNSFIAGGEAMYTDNDLIEKRGLWDNIHAKRKRIAAGSGEKMRKPGSKGAPTKQDFIRSQTEEYNTPIATKDFGKTKHYDAIDNLELNTANRNQTIKEYSYGPIDPNDKQGSNKFWQDKAELWNTTVQAAMEARCGNCAAFNQTKGVLDKIHKALGPEGTKISEMANLGFCELFEFKCAGDRTCDAWLMNGPMEQYTGAEKVSKDPSNPMSRFIGTSQLTDVYKKSTPGEQKTNPVKTIKKVVSEAMYKGREVKLGKPMKGDVKKSKVYVKNPETGNIKKVEFGDPNMKIKKNIPARRRSFRARHHCENPGPRTKARYWSCRAW